MSVPQWESMKKPVNAYLKLKKDLEKLLEDYQKNGGVKEAPGIVCLFWVHLSLMSPNETEQLRQNDKYILEYARSLLRDQQETIYIPKGCKPSS